MQVAACSKVACATADGLCKAAQLLALLVFFILSAIAGKP
jgi:hypothetical protein